MSLTLKVVSYRGLPQSQERSAIFDGDGGVIGRSHDCAFVLPDPDKFISRKHALIEYDGGIYKVTDTSTAGTAVTSRNLLLQHDSLQLNDGDRLRIGDYEIEVSISADERSCAPAFPHIPEPFQLDVAPERLPLADSGGSPPVPSNVSPGTAATFIDTPDVPIFQSHFAPPEPESAAAPDLSGLDLDDLFADLEGPAAASQRSAGPAEEQGWEIPDDFLKGFDETPEAADEALSPSAPNEPVSPPEPTAEGMREQASAEAGAARVPRADPLSPQRQPQPAAAATLPRTEAPPAAQVPPVQEAGRETELLRAFLEGAGIADATLLSHEADLPRLMHAIGELLRNMTDGLMTVLRARTELKSQFRVSMTTMRQVNNNPLKFTVNVDEALTILLAKERPGFIEAKAAVREGFDDLIQHQMAMTAATQASFAEILRRFDPQRFEKAYEEGIVFQKKAKCWDAYCKAYSRLVEEAMENFFGDEFAEAYERQLRALRRGGR